MIEQNQMYSVLFNNFRRVHRNRQNGEIFAIEVEVTEDEWHYLSDFPQDALGEAILKWTERAAPIEKTKREVKQKKEKGPHGQYWNELYRRGFQHIPCIVEWVKTLSGENTWDKLHTRFNVDSMSQVPPDHLINKMRSYGASLDSAITMAEEVKAKTAGVVQ